jgi:hypothetical protein
MRPADDASPGTANRPRARPRVSDKSRPEERGALLSGSLQRSGRLICPHPSRYPQSGAISVKPWRQVGYFGCQSSSRLAFAFDEPRISFMTDTARSPPTRRPSHTGT